MYKRNIQTARYHTSMFNPLQVPSDCHFKECITFFHILVCNQNIKKESQ